MKNFDDFIESLDSETYRTVLSSAEQTMITNGLSGTGTEAYLIALNLLELYHNWAMDNN